MEGKGNPKLENNVNQYMYSFMQKSNEGYDNDIAIQYMGVNISFGELNRRIDNYCKSLLELGVKPGEIVSICMPTTPETVALMYAINKIGAVSNFIDVTQDAEYIRHCINNVDSKLVITFNGILPKIAKIVDKTKLDNIVYVSALESLPLVKKNVIEFLGRVTGKLPKFSTSDQGFKGWNEFLKLSAYHKTEIIVPEFRKEQLGFIEYTSGTTGIPKAIELTNDCANLKVIQYSQNDMIIDRQDVFLDIIPVFVAFGVIMGVQLPLSLGMRDELIAAFDKNDMIKYFSKVKPQHWCLTPSSYSYLVADPKFKTLDMSRSRTIGCGGDGMNKWQSIIIDEKLMEQGSRFKVTNGYGASELGAPFSTGTYKYNKPGSVGFPLPGNEIIIFKEGTFEKAEPNEIGDVCMIGEYPMLGYHGDLEATEKAKITLDDGRVALMLGDKGYVDEEGYIFIKGRAKDILKSNIGDLWPCDVESHIMSSRLVKFCAVSDSSVEGKLTAYIEPLDGYDDLVKEYIRYVFERDEFYKDLDIDFVIVDSIPLTLTGKIDRKKLKYNSDKNLLLLKQNK